jgi:hypothetical protein
MTVDPEDQRVEKVAEDLTHQIAVTKDQESVIRKLVSIELPWNREHRLTRFQVRPSSGPDRLHTLCPFVPGPGKHWSGQVSRRGCGPQPVRQRLDMGFEHLLYLLCAVRMGEIYAKHLSMTTS